MDRNWNRNGFGNNSGSSSSATGEKMYKHSYSGNIHHHQANHYRKKNDYSGQDFYNKNTKPSLQIIKKESLQVASIEEELNSSNFSWIKNNCIN
jgi:hypothetical protein